MRRVVTKRDSEHRVAQDGFPRDVHLMIEPATTGAEHLAMGAEAVDPGSQIPVHVHPDAEEILFVYEGSGRARVGDEEVEVGPETAIFVPWTFSPPGAQEKFRDDNAWKHAARARADEKAGA